MSNRAAELRQLQPPRLQTSTQRPQTAPHTGTTSGYAENFDFRPHRTDNARPDSSTQKTNQAKGASNSDYTNKTDHKPATGPPSSKPGYQHFVLTDPVAFRYLEEDPSTQVISRRQALQGYECYIVEQWTTSRSHPTFTITTHTGDASSTVQVGVLSVPTDESNWSSRLRVYFKALNQYHAKRRETPLGVLMVTNLSGFPSSLTVIPVQDGDLRKHRSDFFVNENLKRLNCSGRVGLTLTQPTAATVAKFHQVYRTSDRNEIYHSVIELVKLCQSALLLFDKLEVDYADGLLCDITERAVNDWWVDLGSEYFTGIEPHDGILGPITVAGLLGLLMGARNRLHAMSAPVSKDPFDVETMKKGISAFQKQQRLPRSRRLDRATLMRLHKSSERAANNESYWAVPIPKAVKSTVAELSGKGGEMVTDLVHRKDRAGIAEIETCDIERFVQLLYGDRARWLWYGKAVKNKVNKEVVGAPTRIGEEREGMEGKALNFRESDGGGFTWTARKSVADGLGLGMANGSEKDRSRETDDLANVAESDEEDKGAKGLIKRSTGFKETKDKVKGVVGLGSQRKANKHSNDPPQTPPRRHQKAVSRDFVESPFTPASPRSPRGSLDDWPRGASPTRPRLQRATSSPASGYDSPKSALQERQRTRNVAESVVSSENVPAYAASFREAPARQSRDTHSPPPPSYVTTDKRESTVYQNDQAMVSDAGSESVTLEPSIAGSIYKNVELNEVLPTGRDTEQDVSRLLRRTVSDSRFVGVNLQNRPDDAYPRHMSFSLAEDSVLMWDGIVSSDDRDNSYFSDPGDQIAGEEYFARESTQLQTMIQNLSSTTATFTESQLETLSLLLDQLSNDQDTLQQLHKPCAERFQNLQQKSDEVLMDERGRLEEGSRELETLAAKMEYETSGLKGRVEEVQSGVGDFESAVGRVERRVRQLEKDETKSGGSARCVVS